MKQAKRDGAQKAEVTNCPDQSMKFICESFDFDDSGNLDDNELKDYSATVRYFSGDDHVMQAGEFTKMWITIDL